MKTTLEKDALVFFPKGRIDSVNAGAVEGEILSALEARPGFGVILDCGETEYMSSAGLRALMRIAKHAPGGPVLRNVSPEVYEVMEVTGFTTLMTVRRRPRELSVEGCEVIGRGGSGTVVRLDADTIVKIYHHPDADALILHEQKMARYAFLKGIPTAISYDMVRADGRWGAVFELVKARTFQDLYLSEPGMREQLIRQFTDVIRLVHGTEAAPGELPDARQVYLEYVDAARAFLDPGVSGRLRGLIGDMPQDMHLIHGDIHLKNVMLCDGEPMLIDMETLSTGSPVFEYAALSTSYELFNEDDPENSLHFFGMEGADCSLILLRTLEAAVGNGAEALAKARDKVRTLGYLRLLYLVAVMGAGGGELREKRIRTGARRLKELCGRVDTLVL